MVRLTEISVKDSSLANKQPISNLSLKVFSFVQLALASGSAPSGFLCPWSRRSVLIGIGQRGTSGKGDFLLNCVAQLLPAKVYQASSLCYTLPRYL